MNVANYGTIFVTIADKDKEEALPLIRRFYDLGFNIEATEGTAAFLKEHGIRTRSKKKISEGSEEILESLPARPCQLRHQHQRHRRRRGRDRRLRDPPLRGGKRRHHVHGAGDGKGAAGRAGGDHAGRVHDRQRRVSGAAVGCALRGQRAFPPK